MSAKDIVLTHPKQPGVTHIVEVAENGTSYAFDSREPEGFWLGGREAAKDHVALMRRQGWTCA